MSLIRWFHRWSTWWSAKETGKKKQRAELKVLAGPSFAGTGQANLQGMLEWAPELEHATRNQTQQPCSEPSRGRTQPPKIDGDLFYDKEYKTIYSDTPTRNLKTQRRHFVQAALSRHVHLVWTEAIFTMINNPTSLGNNFMHVWMFVLVCPRHCPTNSRWERSHRLSAKICLFSDLSKGKLYIKRWQTWSRLSSLSRQWCNQQWTSGALNPFLWVQRGSEPARRRREWRMLPGCLSDSSSSLCLHPCWQHSSTILIKVWCLLN